MCRLNEDARERTTPSDASTAMQRSADSVLRLGTAALTRSSALAHSTLGSITFMIGLLLFPFALHFHSTRLPARLTTTGEAVDPWIAHRHEPLLVRLHL